MVLGCLASWAVNVLFQWEALPFYLVHILVWFLSDWIMLSVVQVSFEKKNKIIFSKILLIT
jgi:ceramide glucosyltransferase